ncbi:MAG: hypothetical protein K9H16_08700, partial [Bacteroidales bacterium]|nr:hypothetical protein [Bacteroidales bacterium]
MLIILLQNPQVQTLTTRLVAVFVNDKLGTQISIGRIEAGFFGTFFLNDLNAYDMRGNRMIGLKTLEVKLSGIKRIEKSIFFSHINIEGVEFMLRNYAPDEPGNFQHFINLFISSAADSLSTEKSPISWKISSDEFTVRNSRFIYENRYKKEASRAIDYNNLEIMDIDLLASGLVVEKDTISLNFKNFAFFEKSGFELREFSGRARFSPTDLSVDALRIITNNSNLDLDLQFRYDSLSAFSDFVNRVNFVGNFRSSRLEMSDIGYFAETMFDMTDLIDFQGQITGTVAKISGKNLDIKYADNTKLKGMVRMSGLPDIYETFIHANIDEFQTNAGDIKSFALPGGIKNIEVPEMIQRMGLVKIEGKFTGFYNDFFSNAVFKSKLGQLNTQIVLKTLEGDNSLSYNGDLVAIGLNAGALFSMKPQLGKVNFILNVDGNGVHLDSLNLTANGIIQSLYFKGYNYKNISVDGTFDKLVFEGRTAIKDENLDFVFNGLIDFNDKMPRFDFNSTINHLNFKALQLSGRDSTGLLSTKMTCDFFATGIDDIRGMVKFDSTVYTEGNHIYTLDHLLLESLPGDEERNTIKLSSDLIDIEIDGDYTISEIVPALKTYIKNYSGNLAGMISSAKPSRQTQQLEFLIHLKNTDQITELFVPGIKIAPNAFLKGNVDLLEMQSKIEAEAEWINISTINIHDWKLKAISDPSKFITFLDFNKVMLKEVSDSDSIGIGIDSLRIFSKLHSDTLYF